MARKPPRLLENLSKKHPAQAERNRELQLIRNAQQRGYFVEQLSIKTMPAISPFSLKSFSLSSVLIAKTDASIPYQFCLIASSDEDLIAKMDASNPPSAQIFKAFVQLPLIAKMFRMTKIARNSGMERNGLYKAFSPEAKNTHFKTVNRALKSMGMHIEIKANSQI